MRIVAGDLRGRRIIAPAGARSRPTSARVREAVFSMVADAVQGAATLDLFAGSGALGLEALSRGAATADFVESHPRPARTIRENLAALDLTGRGRVRRMSWEAALAADRRDGRLYGLVLLDPPYSLIPDIRSDIAEALVPVLSADAVIVAEGPRAEAGWPGLDMPRRDRRHGGTSVSIYRQGGAA